MANVHHPANQYSPTGVYMSFEHYDVEHRAHLKCISGIEGRLVIYSRAVVQYLS